MTTVKAKLPLSSGFQRLPLNLVPCQLPEAVFNILFISNCLLPPAFSSPFRAEVSVHEVPLLGEASLGPSHPGLWGRERCLTREGFRSGLAPRQIELRTGLANCFGVSLEMGAVSLACLGDSCGLGT